MTGELRAALAADEDTPAGVDLAAVRTRAAQLRRTRYAAAAAAVVAAVAVLVPVTVLRPDGPATAAAVPALTCPQRLPGASTTAPPAGDLLPHRPVTGAQVCVYADTPDRPSAGALSGTARLGTAEARDLAARLLALPPADGGPCTRELSTTIGVQFAGPGWSATLQAQLYGCGAVSNGTTTRFASVLRPYLRQLEQRAHR